MAGAESAKSFEPTHRQADILKPARSGAWITLSAFALDPSGNIVAAVRLSQVDSSKPGKVRTGQTLGWLQVYSPAKKVLREFPLDFPPSALSISADGHYLAAGNGQLCKMTTGGKIVARSDIMSMLGLDAKKLREATIEEYRKEREESRLGNASHREALQETIKRLSSMQTARDQARLKALKESLARLDAEDSKEQSEESINRLMEHRLSIPSIGATIDGTVVTLSRNRGYEVWKTGPRFENAKQLIGGLRGCCGQMDIFAAGDRILAAENTKFRVGVYGLDGKLQAAFGERFEKGNNGFGSCCNPMNVTTCSNGDILTAESSIGHIKRFSADGKLLSVVGRARIGGGCKHVSVGFDPKLDRYYVQYEAMSHICVLLPNKEAQPLLEKQDKEQRAAEADFLRLEGKWKLDNHASPKRTARSEGSQIDVANELIGFELKKDGSLMVELPEDMRPRDGNCFRRWVVTGREEKRIVCEVEEADGLVEFVAKIAVKSNDHIEVLMNGQSQKSFRRQK